MILKIFTVFDSKADFFMEPFFSQSKGQALRDFTDVASSGDHPFAKHPEDFTLFELGEYDNQSSSFNLFDSPKSIGLAIELIPKSH